MENQAVASCLALAKGRPFEGLVKLVDVGTGIGPWSKCCFLALTLLTYSSWVQAQSVEGVILPDLPPEVSPGEKIRFRPPPGSPEGSWLLAGVPAEKLVQDQADKKSKKNKVAADLFLELPAELAEGGSLSISLRDKSGDWLLKDELARDVVVVPARFAGDSPSITGASPLAIAGQSVCVCGNFPNLEAWRGIRLAERNGEIYSATQRMAILSVPKELVPGRYPVAGAPESGYTARDRVYTDVIRVDGALDVNSLRRGQATQLSLTVYGTTDPISIKVVNKTPQIISIGAAEITLITSGGTPNRVTHQVDSLAVGAFNISYTLAGERCPCQVRRPDTSSRDPETIRDYGHAGSATFPCPSTCLIYKHRKGDVARHCTYEVVGPQDAPFVEYIPGTANPNICYSGIPLDVEPRDRLFVHGIHSNSEAWDKWFERVRIQMDYLGFRTVKDDTGKTPWGDGSASLADQVYQLAQQINSGFPGAADDSVEVFAHSLGALKVEALLQVGFENLSGELRDAARKLGRIHVFQGAHGGCRASRLNGDRPHHLIPPRPTSYCPASLDIGLVNDYRTYLGGIVEPGRNFIPGFTTHWDFNKITWQGRKHISFIVATSNGGDECKGVLGFICDDTVDHDGVVYDHQMAPTWFANFRNAEAAGRVRIIRPQGSYCHMDGDVHEPPRLSGRLMEEFVGIRRVRYFVPEWSESIIDKDVTHCDEDCFCWVDSLGACSNRLDCTVAGQLDCSQVSVGGGTPGPGGEAGGGYDPATVNLREAASWTVCAPEGGICIFSGTREVRFGARGNYVGRNFSEFAICEASSFVSDPLPGFLKVCELRN